MTRMCLIPIVLIAVTSCKTRTDSTLAKVDHEYRASNVKMDMGVYILKAKSDEHSKALRGQGFFSDHSVVIFPRIQRDKINWFRRFIDDGVYGYHSSWPGPRVVVSQEVYEQLIKEKTQLSDAMISRYMDLVRNPGSNIDPGLASENIWGYDIAIDPEMRLEEKREKNKNYVERLNKAVFDIYYSDKAKPITKDHLSGL